ALAASVLGTVWMWDLDTGKELGRCQPNGVNYVAISSDGRRALFGNFLGNVVLWDLEKWAETRRFQEARFLASVDFAPDGRIALLAGWRVDDHTRAILSLWDLQTGKVLRRLEERINNGFSRAIFSPDGRHVLSAGRDTIVRLWEVETGKQVRQFTGHTGGVSDVAFTPDGRRAVSGGTDYSDQT